MSRKGYHVPCTMFLSSYRIASGILSEIMRNTVGTQANRWVFHSCFQVLQNFYKWISMTETQNNCSLFLKLEILRWKKKTTCLARLSKYKFSLFAPLLRQHLNPVLCFYWLDFKPISRCIFFGLYVHLP